MTVRTNHRQNRRVANDPSTTPVELSMNIGTTPLAVFLVLVTLMPAASAAAQDLHPSRLASPVGIAKTFLGDTYLKVTYGRPYVRNRAIFGDPADGNTYLVPFGETWRTGANEATEITITSPLMVAGQQLVGAPLTAEAGADAVEVCPMEPPDQRPRGLGGSELPASVVWWPCPCAG